MSAPPSDRATLTRIDAYLNRALAHCSDVERIGPFLAFFNRETELPFLSFARPAEPTAAAPAELARWAEEVRTEFGLRGRVCRWEFLGDTAPTLAAALSAAGFPPPAAQPLMLLEPTAFRPTRVDWAEFRLLTAGDPALGLTLSIQREAFGLGGGPLSESDLRSARGLIRHGMRVFGAWPIGDKSMPIAVASHIPKHGVTEIAGVAVNDRYRNRGLGGAVSSLAAQDALAQGLEVIFLSAAHEGACRLYASLGFRQIGLQLGTADGAACA